MLAAPSVEYKRFVPEHEKVVRERLHTAIAIYPGTSYMGKRVLSSLSLHQGTHQIAIMIHLGSIQRLPIRTIFRSISSTDNKT